jgi:CBS domain-containing protein
MHQTRTVSAHMMAVPHTIDARATLAEAASRLRELGLPQLPVLDHEGRPCGILLERDLLLVRQLQIDLESVTVGRLLPRDAFSLTPDESLASAVRSMASRAACSAVVVSGAIVRGMFTQHDALRLLAELLEAEARPSVAPPIELQGSLLDEAYLLERAEESARRLSEAETSDVSELYLAIKELLDAQRAQLEADQRELEDTQPDQLPLHRSHLAQLCSEREHHTQALAALLAELEEGPCQLQPLALRVSGTVAELRSHREQERDALRFVS